MKRLTKDWKTSVFGGLAAAAGTAATMLPQYAYILAPIAGVSGALFAFYSKDSDVVPPPPHKL